MSALVDTLDDLTSEICSSGEDPIGTFEAFRLAGPRGHFTNYPLNKVELPLLAMSATEQYLAYLINALQTPPHDDMSGTVYNPGMRYCSWGLIGETSNATGSYSVQTGHYGPHGLLFGRIDLVNDAVNFSVRFNPAKTTWDAIHSLVFSLESGAGALRRKQERLS